MRSYARNALSKINIVAFLPLQLLNFCMGLIMLQKNIVTKN